MALIKCPDCGKEFSDQAVACPNCGRPNALCRNHDYQHNRSAYHHNKSISSNFKFILIIVIVLLALFLRTSIFLLNKTKTNETISYRLNGTFAENNIVVQKPEIEIDNFEYTLENNVIKLNRYKGDSDAIEINPRYEIGGTYFETDIMDFQISSDSVHTIVFNEGIVDMNESIFNGCKVEQIYFPKSLKIMYDHTLAYLHPEEGTKIKIYYAGTHEEWNNIFTEYTHIVNSESLGESAGKAAADFINGLFGMEYDASQFEYYFLSSVEALSPSIAD